VLSHVDCKVKDLLIYDNPKLVFSEYYMMRTYLTIFLFLLLSILSIAQPTMDTVVQIKPVTISSQIIVESITPEKLFVEDYLITENGLLVLGFYTKPKELQLLLLNGQQDVIAKQASPPFAEKLTKDCLGNYFVILGQAVQKIEFVNMDFALTGKQSLKDFYTDVAPCIGESANRYYFEHNYFGDQVKQFSYFHKTLETSTEVALIADREKMRQLRESSNGYLLANSTDKYDLFFKSGGSKWWEIIWEKEAFYAPIDAAMFSAKYHLYLFNHLDGNLEIFNKKGELQSSKKIDYHKIRGWRPTIYFDKQTEQAYTRIVKNGKSFVSEINLETGELFDYAIELPFMFISNLKVNNGEMYFLYKANGADDKMTLYKMIL